MINKTPFSVHLDLIEQAKKDISNDALILSINEPTGRFFYDPWTIKSEFRGTVWEKIINTIPGPLGEARIITLESGTNYLAHADIDDRYHLNLQGEDCFLINLEKQQLFPISTDGIWYDMSAGFLHTAANFGRISRTQLVVRKLLIEKKLIDPVEVIISVGGSSQDDSRFIFDRTVSPWLNKINKKGNINDFKYVNQQIKFIVEKLEISELDNIIKTTDFKMEIL